jgi:hypothetical protein
MDQTIFSITNLIGQPLDLSYTNSLWNCDRSNPKMQLSQSKATENFLQLRHEASRIEKDAKCDQQGYIAAESGAYDETNPTSQVQI